MPQPDRLLILLRQAIQAFRDTPGRRGRIVHLADASDVLAAGDLHGNLGNFRLLLKAADLARHPRRHLILQEAIHGDFAYADASDKSHQLLDLIAALKVQYPQQVHFLLGNHELAQMSNRLVAKGDTDLNARFRQGVQTAYGPHADEVYAHYVQMLAAAPLAVRTPNRVFLSHSLPPAFRLAEFDATVLERDEMSDADLAPGGSAHSLVWGRDTSLANVTAFLNKVDADLLITGHIPCDAGYDAPNPRQLILDTLGYPAAYCLFPADRPISHSDLTASVKLL